MVIWIPTIAIEAVLVIIAIPTIAVVEQCKKAHKKRKARKQQQKEEITAYSGNVEPAPIPTTVPVMSDKGLCHDRQGHAHQHDAPPSYEASVPYRGPAPSPA